MAETVQHFITAMDSLKLNMAAVDQVGYRDTSREGGSGVVLVDGGTGRTAGRWMGLMSLMCFAGCDNGMIG